MYLYILRESDADGILLLRQAILDCFAMPPMGEDGHYLTLFPTLK